MKLDRLRMVIADDEEFARKAIVNVVPWDELGIEIIAQAVNGHEAYALCNEMKPDILLTDIKMPAMDGIDLSAKLFHEGARVKIVLLSGIQDFNYARTAIEVGVEGYLLKPPDKEEIIRLFEKIKRSLEIERNKDELLESSRLQMKKSRMFVMK